MSAIPTLDALRGVTRVHNAMRVVLHQLDRGLAATNVYVDERQVTIVAPSLFHKARWEDTYPAGTVEAGGLAVPLHVCVAGDVEGNQS